MLVLAMTLFKFFKTSVDFQHGGKSSFWLFCGVQEVLHPKSTHSRRYLFSFFFFPPTGYGLAKANNLCALRPKEIITVRLCSGNSSDADGRTAREVPDTVDESDSYEQDIKSKILQSSLQYVSEHGWSRDTVAAGITRFLKGYN